MTPAVGIRPASRARASRVRCSSTFGAGVVVAAGPAAAWLPRAISSFRATASGSSSPGLGSEQGCPFVNDPVDDFGMIELHPREHHLPEEPLCAIDAEGFRRDPVRGNAVRSETEGCRQQVILGGQGFPRLLDEGLMRRKSTTRQ